MKKVEPVRHSEILPIHHPLAIPRAKEIIRNHGTIAFPTDTIYGIAVDVFSVEGIQKIYKIKERPSEKALPVLIGEFSQLDSLVLFVSDSVRKIIEAFWPGPLTLILPKGPEVSTDLSPYPTIGVRMPNLPFTLTLLCETGPLATTSANLSGGSNPMTAQDVIAQLDGRVDLILDGGPTPGPVPSTIVDVSGSEMKILRQGAISLEAIRSLLNHDTG